MENLDLSGKVAIVTGSSSGIGRATATLFIRRGAKVTVTGRDKVKLQSVVDELKNTGAKEDQILAAAGDLTVDSFRQDLVEKTVTHFGKLDILVNNAGYLVSETLPDITEAGLDMMLDIMLKVPIFLSKAALPHLETTKGCIVNTSTTITTENFYFLRPIVFDVGLTLSSFLPVRKSRGEILSFRPQYPGMFSYTVAKHAVDKFTEYAALEFRSLGIRVNSVKPGTTETDLFRDLFKGDKQEEKSFLDTQKQHSMIDRVGKPEDVAELIAYLSSSAASYITAHHFVVDGGRAKYFHHGVQAPAL